MAFTEEGGGSKVADAWVKRVEAVAGHLVLIGITLLDLSSSLIFAEVSNLLLSSAGCHCSVKIRFLFSTSFRCVAVIGHM